MPGFCALTTARLPHFMTDQMASFGGRYRAEAEQQIKEAGCRTRKDIIRVVETVITLRRDYDAAAAILERIPPDVLASYADTDRGGRDRKQRRDANVRE